MDNSTSSSQLEAEIAVLTQSVAQLETEISQSPEPLCRPSARFINLDRFRKAQNSFWEWDGDMKQSIKDDLVSTQDSDSNLITESGEERTHEMVKGTKELAIAEEDRERNMFRSIPEGSCMLVKIQESIFSRSEDSISPAERAKMKVLSILRSYLHNLENGSLVTGDIVDEEVAAEMRYLVDMTHTQGSKAFVWKEDSLDGEGSIELSEKSDEEGVIYELRRYRRGILESRANVDGGVIEAAQAILDWSKVS
ncbi:hypothetical protein EG329_011766 [Mollisiaceae sp. DMI_Dod_QoI]|nr:hypothetical protein EG329_011766 [Helotiales sp. DMI_Dod_QoI]